MKKISYIIPCSSANILTYTGSIQYCNIRKNEDYIAAPHQLCANFLLKKIKEPVYKGCESICFSKNSEGQVFCHLLFAFNNQSNLDYKFDSVFVNTQSSYPQIMTMHKPKKSDAYCQMFAEGIFFNSVGDVLLLGKDDKWDLPGGAQKFGEYPEEVAKRNFHKQIKIDINVNEKDLRVIDFSDELSEDGVLAQRIVYKLDNAISLPNIENARFFPTTQILESELLSSAQKNRIKLALSDNKKPIYSVYSGKNIDADKSR